MNWIDPTWWITTNRIVQIQFKVFNLRGDVSRPFCIYAFPADEYKADGGIGRWAAITSG